jgi:hypothetical protein
MSGVAKSVPRIAGVLVASAMLLQSGETRAFDSVTIRGAFKLATPVVAADIYAPGFTTK